MSTTIKYPTSTNAVQKTLDAQLLSGATASMTLNSVTGIQNKEGVCVIDAVDANGTATPAKREYIKFTGVSGSTLTGLTRNADGGSSDQDHAVGAIVQFGPDVLQQQAIIDSLLTEHNESGTHKSATVTTLKATGAEINTGTEDAKIVTPKAIADSWINNGYNSLSRQAIINGNFDVWQRGTSFNQATAKVYGADRWATFNNVTNQASTITRQDGTGVYGSIYCLRYQRTAGQTGTNTCILVTSIESIDTQKLRGKKLTLSFYARKGANYSPTSSVFTSAIRTGTGTDEEVLNGYTGVNDTLTQNNTLTTNWQKFTYTTPTVLADNVNELSLWFTWTPTGTAGAADYFEITQVQLCAGDVALPFMPKSYEEELRACMRYYYRVDSTGANFTSFGFGWHVSTTESVFNIPFKTQMRITPTASFSAVNDFAVGKDLIVTTDIVLDMSSSPVNGRIVTTVASGLSQYQPGELRSNNKTTAWIGFSSEL